MVYHDTKHLTQNLFPDSNVSLGYEIEKVEFNIDGTIACDQGDHVGEYQVFRGYEYDGSCGVEAITHIISGDIVDIPQVFSMFDEAKEVIDSRANSRCAGHISISIKDMHPRMIASRLRPAFPILYSIWRDRLSNTYCNANVYLEHEGSNTNNRSSVINLRNNNYMEIRLAPVIHSLVVLKFRHKLMTRLIDLCAVQGCTDFDAIKLALYPIIQAHYGDKSEQLLELADDFHAALSEPLETCYSNAPMSVKEHFLKQATDADRQARWQAQREAERLRLTTERLAVELALRSTRRRERTLLIGERFNVSCVIDGIRRSRSVTLSTRGFTIHRGGTLLMVKPQDCKVITVTHNGDAVIWEEYRRAGETLKYTPMCTVAAREPQHIHVARYGSPRLVQDSNCIYYTGYWGNDSKYTSVLNAMSCTGSSRTGEMILGMYLSSIWRLVHGISLMGKS